MLQFGQRPEVMAQQPNRCHPRQIQQQGYMSLN